MTQEFTKQTANEAAYLESMRSHSLHVWSVLQKSLAELDLARHGVITVYAVGSIGRLEVNENSDVDGVVVVEDEFEQNQLRPLMEAIESNYAAAGLRVAKGTGIYRQPVTRTALLDEGARGSLSESPDVYGKRIQLMLDARVLYHEAAFLELQQHVLEWFLPASQTGAGLRSSFLLAELKRYYNAYSNWQRFKFDKSADDGWLLRQAKLKITRTTTIMAVSLLIGGATDRKRKISIGKHLSLTPLERIQSVFNYYDEHDAAAHYAKLYNSALSLISDAGVRRKLIIASPVTEAEIGAGFPPEFSEICVLSDQMGEIITRFVLRRQHDWLIEFYRQALF